MSRRLSVFVYRVSKIGRKANKNRLSHGLGDERVGSESLRRMFVLFVTGSVGERSEMLSTWKYIDHINAHSLSLAFSLSQTHTHTPVVVLRKHTPSHLRI